MRFAIFLQFFIISCSSLGILCLTDKNDVTGGSKNSLADTTKLPRLEGRIVNGTKAAPGQFPHQVSLRRSYSNSHFCGGSVIAAQWILTAAHCMFNNNGVQIFPWTIEVVAGQLLLTPDHKLSQKRAVGAIIVHSGFDRMTLRNDIALLKLTTPLKLNTSTVKATKLEKIIPKPGTVCQVSGWGYLSENEKIVSNHLMYVPLPLLSPSRCRELLVNVTDLPLGMFCAGYKDGLRDACQGDSGGGMICGKVLTGIVSGGEGCARPALPGIYTDVAYYRNWVEIQIKGHNGTVGNGTNWNGTNDWIPTRPHGKNSSLNISSSLSFYLLVVAYTMLSYLGYNMA